MTQYVSAKKLTILASLAALLALTLLIFGCGEDEPEATPQPVPTAAPVDISPLVSQISRLEQSMLDAMAQMQPPLSEDEIRSLIETAVSQSAPEGISSSEIQAMVDSAVAAAAAEGVNQEDVTAAIGAALAEAAAGQAEPLTESDVARIVRSAIATPVPTPAPTPAPTAMPTPAPTPTEVAAMVPVDPRLKVAINVPQYGENLEASIHNSIGGFLLPNAESLVGSDHINGEFYPMLSSGWELSNNAMTWTVNLRQNVPWHGENGNFSSADVIHSLAASGQP